MRLSAFVLAASILCTPAAHAATFNATITIGALNSTEPGLVVKADDLNPAAGPFTSASLSFDLASIGDMFSSEEFVLYTDEAVVEADDSVVSAYSILFDVAGFGVAELLGTTNGGIVGGVHFGFVNYFNGTPGFALLGIGGGKALRFTGTPAPFNEGVLALAPGRNNGVAATWTVELVPAAVPLPAALPLALGAHGLLAVASRRRKTSAA